MSPDDERHGTYAGHQAHRRAGSTPCEPCAEAGRARKRKRKAERDRNRCTICDKTTERALCISCENAGSVRPSAELDETELDPPTWVRVGLIWVAA